MTNILLAGPQQMKLTAIQGSLPRTAHARFRDLIVPALYEAAYKYGLDAVGMVAQAAIETGWGNFPGLMKAEYNNTCGLKWHDPYRALYPDQVGNQARAHAAFSNWRTGAEAHAQHLLAYMKVRLPVWQVIVDPRFENAYSSVNGPEEVITWGDLTSRWSAPWDGVSEKYGDKIERIRSQILSGGYV